MSTSDTLESLQSALTELYDLSAMPDVREFVLSDRAQLAAHAELRATDEQLIVVEQGNELSMALYIDRAVLERLARFDPLDSLTQHNLADYLTVAEGVSHFVYVAWNAGHDKPVTLLELELQAEIDKYVLAALLLRRQSGGRFPRELHRALFERARIDPVAAGARAGMYRTASNYAARFCARVARELERTAASAARDLSAELRRFYRWNNPRKLAFIEHLA